MLDVRSAVMRSVVEDVRAEDRWQNSIGMP